MLTLLAFKCADTFFFDKLLYRKSPWYGYAKPEQDWSIIATISDAHPELKKRLAATSELIAWQKEYPLASEDITTLISSTPTVAPGKKQRTILVVGDSVIYGAGVLTSQRFGEQLEKILDSREPTKVITLAQPGDDIIDHLVKAVAGYHYYQPDLIIITLYHNDLIDLLGNSKYPDQDTIERYLSEKCPGQLSKPVDWSAERHYGGDAWYYNVFGDTVHPANANLCYLSESVKVTNKLPIPVIFYTLNSVGEYSDLVFTGFRQTITAANGIVVSYNTNQTNNPYTPVSPIEGHPSVETHRGFAERLAPFILEVLP